MIPARNLEDKSYETLMGEAVAKIPLYNREWTNHNPTDPGIMVLENLSAFSALLGQECNELTDEIRFRLLGLAGFSREKGTPGKCYVGMGEYTGADRHLPRGQKLYAGDVCFETEEGAEIYDAKVYDMYRISRGEKHSLRALTAEYGIPGGTEIFGEDPKGGEEVYFSFRGLPAHKRSVSFYVEISDTFHRNPFCMEDVKLFAKLSWQVYTDQGFAETKARDDTCLFLKSGVVEVELPTENVVREPESGLYQIRCRLDLCAYDIPPKASHVRGILAEAVQRDTKSAALLFPGEKCPAPEHFLLGEGEIRVYVEEEPDRFYLWGEDGVAYSAEDEEGRKKMVFKDSVQGKRVMLLCQEPEILPYRDLGRLFGYDGQEIDLPPFARVYGGNFSLLIEEKKGGRICCHKVLPESKGEGDVFFTLDEERGKVVVGDCGGYEGARVLLADYCLYQGSGGNLVKGAKLRTESGGETYILENVMEISGGKFQETFEEVQKRFVRDLKTGFTMVTAEDCESLAGNIPGLSIHKMKATAIPEKNEIRIVVKPNSRERCPGLSPLYQKRILDFLDRYRILNTRIIPVQPDYVPIHVQALICVKKQYGNCEPRVEEVFRRLLDGAGSTAGFGETVSFHKIYQAVEHLDCVEEIRELSLRPGRPGAVVEGLDIRLRENALYVPGELSIEFRNLP